MRSHRPFSTAGISIPTSPLVATFVERMGRKSASARQVICEQVSSLAREASLRASGDFLFESAKIRGIVSIDTRSGLKSDGFIEPLGSSTADGFKVVLREGVANNRQRFTLAHEICHTFFYEAAPEIKFSEYEVDFGEEALCNFGAACLLVPDGAIRQSDLVSRPCLASLDTLSQQFKVSPETMILRLRDLGLWRCEYSCWHKMTGGEFKMERFYGWGKIEWNWSDTSVLERAWSTRQLHRGEAILWGQSRSGNSTGKSVHYELKRRGDLLRVLWQERRLYEETPPLLAMTKKPMNTGRRRVSLRQNNLIPASRPARYWWLE